jgi:hypothetical protein
VLTLIEIIDEIKDNRKGTGGILIGAMEVATIAKTCKVGTTYKAHQQQVSSF